MNAPTTSRAAVLAKPPTSAFARMLRPRRPNVPGLIGTLFTLFIAGIWAFPIYWAVVTSLKTETQVLSRPTTFFLRSIDINSYIQVLTQSQILRWYFNSVFTAFLVTFFVVFLCMLCGYAISQLSFPGKNVLYWALLAGFMIPFQGLIVPLFVMLADFGWVNSYQGIVLPQIIAPITIIIYKQFFDAMPPELRDSAVIDGAGEFRILFNIFLPINWGITTALAIVTFIGAWNNFFWPFIITTQEPMMTIPVGITQVSDAFGVQYARTMAIAVLSGLPVALAYLVFQKKVTEGIMVTAGLKG
jgi:multiple sugar transport system permease protein